MNAFSFLSVAVFVSCIFCGAYALYLDPRSSAHRLLAVSCAAFALWALADAFTLHAPSKDACWSWLRYSSPAWAAFPSIMLHLFLELSRPGCWRRQRWLVALLYLPGAIFVGRTLTGIAVISDFRLGRFGWTDVLPTHSAWLWLFVTYYLGFVGCGLALVWAHGKRAPFQREKRQAHVIVGSFAATGLIGTANLLVFPLMGLSDAPTVAAPALVLWLLGTWVAIIRYRFLALDPKLFADSIVSSMRDALILVDPHGRIAMVNRVAEELLGYDHGTLVSQPVQILLGAHQAGTTLGDSRLAVELRKHHGGTVPVDLSRFPLRDEHGDLRGTAWVARDMSEPLRMQEWMRQSERMAAIGQLAAGIAHEINNPLGVILGYGQGLERRFPEEDPLRTPVSSIIREATRCKMLVKELLTFSRTAKASTEPVDVNAVVCSTAVMLEARAKAQNVQLVVELSDARPIVMANRTQLEQVLMHLGANALDAMTSSGKLLIRTATEGEETALLEVSDTGTGIPESIRTRIFEPFFTTKEVGKGRGLGLSLVHEIVWQHGGSIEVCSGIGAGTCMRVRVPVVVGGWR